MDIDTAPYTISCTGDACVGDIIIFTEGVFGGSYRAPKLLGLRHIAAEIIRDSYGEKKQQHTFTLRVLQSSGHQPLEPGTETRRKGRNIYRDGTRRQRWAESKRQAALDNKHARGDAAREARALRKEEASSAA
jgi:hypothetical protein